MNKMTKSESKYFNTASLMDEALIRLLETKEFEYISVKEVCQKAGVNRSTFYLHYETMDDLLTESVEWLNKQFASYFNSKHEQIWSKIDSCSLNELQLINHEYLLPYLTFVRDNKRIMKVAISKPYTLKAITNYKKLYINLFEPILKRFNIPECDREYMMSFYINGIMGVINQWLKNDCKDDMEHIINLIIQFVMPNK